MNYFLEFQNKFRALLSAPSYKQHQFSRWDSFEFIVKELFEKNRELFIVETGTLNTTNDWLGYGQSTLIWDWVISKTKGLVYSVDIDIEKIKIARLSCNNINFINCDSIGFLRGLEASKIDLLYLDSFNWSLEEHISSCLHHMTELGAIYDRLPRGCLIACDDRHNDFDGKHVLVETFFSKIVKIKPISKDHLVVWRKP